MQHSMAEMDDSLGINASPALLPCHTVRADKSSLCNDVLRQVLWHASTLVLDNGTTIFFPLVTSYMVSSKNGHLALQVPMVTILAQVWTHTIHSSCS